MRLSTLTNDVAKQLRLDPGLVNVVLEAIFDRIATELATGGDYVHPNFGRFYVAEAAPRAARHPVTREAITIPSQRRVRFHYADYLHAQVNAASHP